MSRVNLRRSRPEERRARRARLRGHAAQMILIGGLALASMAGGWRLNQTMSVSQWKIDAAPALKRAIDDRLRAMTSRSFLQTRPALLRRQWLASIPDIAELKITRTLPDRLYVRAKARLPVALWQDEENTIHLLDAGGQAYRTLRKGETLDLPMLRMHEGRLKPAHALLMAIRRQRIRNIRSLSEIRATGGGWQVYFMQGEKWLLPRGGETAVIRRLASILKQHRWQRQPWRVDARAQSRWFFRPARQEGVI